MDHLTLPGAAQAARAQSSQLRALAHGLAMAMLASATPSALAATHPLADAIADVAAKVSPSVVSIQVERRPARYSHYGRAPAGSGSGVIVRSDGYILTNNHVVRTGDAITVTLKDGRRLPAEVVGTDPATDLAVLRVKARGLRAARFADSTKARVGEWVVAIGSPFGLDYTVTAGVLSAVGRDRVGGRRTISDYLQTDASINPGNSGGPLVNLKGEVLGINTMIIGPANVGIGFAVPSALAKHTVKQLIATGEVRRAWIGVVFQPGSLGIPPALAKALSLNGRQGALITQVLPDGPARKAGLKEGDVVTEVDGSPIRSSQDLLRSVISKEVGSRIRVRVVRNGKPRELTLVTGERPDFHGGERRRRSKPRREPATKAFGLELQRLTPRVASQLGFDGKHGVVVAGVLPGSAGEQAGLRRGDILVEADRQTLRGIPQLAKALDDGSALLRVVRRGSVFYTVLTRP